MVIDSITLSMPGPSTPAMATASRTAGKAKKTSSVRMMSMSTLPPKNPATSPRITLITLATVTGEQRDDQRHLPAPEQPAEDVAPLPVESEQVARRCRCGARRCALSPTVGS